SARFGSPQIRPEKGRRPLACSPMPLPQPIYMDHAASTPCDPRVVGAMLPFLTSCPGNPSNRNHRFGWEAAQAVEHARKQVAAMLGCSPIEIYFTSGATESNNLAVKGIAQAAQRRNGSPARTSSGASPGNGQLGSC